jgi:Tol biopolymer transport system component
MKPLIWKEWRQNWLVLVLGLALVVLFPIIYAVHPRHLGVAAQDVVVMQYGVALLYALLMGSTLVAPEIASGTIGELFARPVNPWKVWLSKLLFGLMTTAGVFLVAVLAGALAAAPVFKTSVFSMFLRGLEDSSVSMVAVFLLPALVLAISMFTSTLTEQPILAMIGTVIVMAAVVAYSFALRDARVLTSSLAAVIALAVFLALSGLLFARGQIHTGVRGPKWRLAALSVGCVAALAVIALFCGYADVLHLGPHENYEVTALSASPDGTKLAIEAHASGSYGVNAIWITDLQQGKQLFRDASARPSWYGYGWAGGAWSADGERFAMWSRPTRPKFSLRIAPYYGITSCLKILDTKMETVSILKKFNELEDNPWAAIFWSDSGDVLYYLVLEDAGGRRIEHTALDGSAVKRIPVGPLHPRRTLGQGSVSAIAPILLCSFGGPSRAAQYSDRRNIPGLLNLETGDIRVIDLGSDSEVAGLTDVSPDGRYVVYAKYTRPLERREIPMEVEKPPRRLFLKDLSTGVDKPILEGRTWQAHSLGAGGRVSGFSPDGTQFVLSVHYKRVIEPGRRGIESSRWETYLVDIEQDSAMQLMDAMEPAWMRGVLWSPNGAHLAVLRHRRLPADPMTGRQIYRLGGRRIPAGPMIGRDIYRSELSVFRRDGSRASTWIADGTARMAFEWLSDDELVYADGREIYRIKADGTGKTKVFPP